MCHGAAQSRGRPGGVMIFSGFLADFGCFWKGEWVGGPLSPGEGCRRVVGVVFSKNMGGGF